MEVAWWLLKTDSYEEVGALIQRRVLELAGAKDPTPEDVEVLALGVRLQARRGNVEQAAKEFAVLPPDPPSLPLARSSEHGSAEPPAKASACNPESSVF